MPGWVIDKDDLSSEYGANGIISGNLTEMPYDFSLGAAVVLNDEIHILGSNGSTDELKHYKWNGTSWVSVSTLPYSMWGGAAVVLNDEIHILGGGQGDDELKHYKWNGKSWVSVSTLPYHLFEGSAVVLNNKIHILGGENSVSETNNDKKHYILEEQGWISAANTMGGIGIQQATVMNNKLYILCRKYLGDAYKGYLGIYDESENSWSYWNVSSSISNGLLVACSNNKIRILGGSDHKRADYEWDPSVSGTPDLTSMSTLPYDFYDSSAVVIGCVIFLLGSFSTQSGDHRRFYAWDGTSWSTSYNIDMGTIPYDFEEGCAVVLNNEVHILGSSTSNNGTKHYKLTDNGWVSVSTLPYTFYQGCAVVLNNEIHILGGYNNNRLHYKWNGSSWSSVSTLPYEFYYGSAIVYNNEIHILGGRYNGTKHYKYSSGSWVNVDTIPYSFERGYAVIFNDEIHILGSYDNGTNHYKWNGSSWSSVSTLPFEAFSASAEVLNGEIHILGSRVPGNKTKHCKWNGTSWSVVTAIPYDFYYGSVVLLGSKLYLLGSIDYPTRNYYYLESAAFYKIMDAWTKEVRPNDMVPLYEEIGTGRFSYYLDHEYAGQKFFIIFEGGFGDGTVSWYHGETVEEEMWEAWTPKYIYPANPNQDGYYYGVVPSDGSVDFYINRWGANPSKVSLYLGKTETPSIPKYAYKMKNVLRAWIGNAMNKAKRVLMKMPFASSVTDSNPSVYTSYSDYQSLFVYADDLLGNVLRNVYLFSNNSWVLQTDKTIPSNEVSSSSYFRYKFIEYIDGSLHRFFFDYVSSPNRIRHYKTDSSGVNNWIALNDLIGNEFLPEIVSSVTEKAMFDVIVFNEELHLVIGTYFNGVSKHYKWDSLDDAWIKMADTPMPPYHPTQPQPDPYIADYTFYRNFLVVYHNKLYLFYSETDYHTHYIKYSMYNEIDDTWGDPITCVSYTSTHDENKGALTKVFVFKGFILIFGYESDYIGDPISNTWVELNYQAAYSDGVVVGRGEGSDISVFGNDLHIIRREIDRSNTNSPIEDPIPFHEKLNLYFAQPSGLDG